MMDNPVFLDEYRRMLALAETGLVYAKDPFDKERYVELREITLNLISKIGNEPVEKLSDLYSGNEGYPTPKVDVRAFIKKSDKVLLVQDKVTSEWSLLGGFADIGLSPKENIVKEVEEETGLMIEVKELAGLFDTHLRPDIPQLTQYYKLIFDCKVIGREFQENHETIHFDYFDLEQLPNLSLKRTTPEQLSAVFNRDNVIFE